MTLLTTYTHKQKAIPVASRSPKYNAASKAAAVMAMYRSVNSTAGRESQRHRMTNG